MDHMDENDLKTLADSFMDSLGRLCAHIDLSPFAIQIMSRGVDEGQVSPEKAADMLSCKTRRSTPYFGKHPLS